MNELNKKGFTLVELLVVIAVIAILAGVVLVAINPAKILAESRDATRLSDMDTLNKAISLAIADEEVTLVATTGTSGPLASRAVNGTGWVSYTLPAGKVGLGKYLAILPEDPRVADGYVYGYAANADGYVLRCALESLKYQPKMTTDGGPSDVHYELGTDPALDLFGP